MPNLFQCAGYLFFFSFLTCNNNTNSSIIKKPETPIREKIKTNPAGLRTVHVFVALCDNKYQGIVPVGKTIGNGQDPDNNLYWGCDNGVRTYFKKKMSDWNFIFTQKKVSPVIVERVLFKHKTKNIYLLADAYDGRYIRQTTIDFLQAASGGSAVNIPLQKDSIYFGGAAGVASYIGHDGLMDFQLPSQSKPAPKNDKKTIILACYSKNYFAPHLKHTGAYPLLWTTNLMAPEAYTLHDALAQWADGKPDSTVQLAAAKAYARFQKCSVRAARHLLVTGW